MRNIATRLARSTYTIVLLFLAAVLLLAYFDEPSLFSRVQRPSLSLLTIEKKKDKFPFPDFDKYIHTQTLSPKEFGLGEPDERVVIIGDTHGMSQSLHDLLSKVSYTPHKDTLVLVGDILAKSTRAGSIALLDFYAQQKFSACDKGQNLTSGDKSRNECKPLYAVRGNHDQMVVQWRAWRDWFKDLHLTFPSVHPQGASLLSSDSTTSVSSAAYDVGSPVETGSLFLSLVETEWLREQTAHPKGPASDVEEWVDIARKRAAGTWRAEWWKRVPKPGKGHNKDWIMFGEHYWIAKDMKPQHAELLYSLPLVIHVPSEHLFIAHAGLLPSDPRRASDDEHQPLAHPPSLDDNEGTLKDFVADYEYPLLPSSYSQPPIRQVGAIQPDNEIEQLRVIQERAVLHDIPQNRDPWVLLNIRGVRKSGKVTRQSDKGKPWAEIWNNQMKRCVGFSNENLGNVDVNGRENDGDAAPLPCYPSTVVYGHAASRGLDVRRWSVGLDSGCLYGGRLTALILTRSQDNVAAPTVDLEDAEEESSEEEYISDSSFGDLNLNTRSTGAAGGSVIRRTRRPRTRTRSIRLGDKDSDLDAGLVSVMCPQVADLS